MLMEKYDRETEIILHKELNSIIDIGTKMFNYLNGKVNNNLAFGIEFIIEQKDRFGINSFNWIYINLNSFAEVNYSILKIFLLDTIVHELTHCDQHIHPVFYIDNEEYCNQIEKECDILTCNYINEHKEELCKEFDIEIDTVLYEYEMHLNKKEYNIRYLRKYRDNSHLHNKINLNTNNISNIFVYHFTRILLSVGIDSNSISKLIDIDSIFIQCIDVTSEFTYNMCIKNEGVFRDYSQLSYLSYILKYYEGFDVISYGNSYNKNFVLTLVFYREFLNPVSFKPIYFDV